MQCPYCKKELLVNTMFCPECGQIIEQRNFNQGESKKYWDEYKVRRNSAENERKICEAKVLEVRKSKRRIISAVVMIFLVFGILFYYSGVIWPAQSYSKAQELFENKQYKEAADIFSSLGNYEDAIAMVDLCDYNEAIVLYENGEYEMAEWRFRQLIDYENSRYYISQIELRLLYNSKVDDVIILGDYSGNPIEWIVISKNQSEALLVSKYYIDVKVANESNSGKYTCWSGSTLRKWLNEEFLSISFSDEIESLLLTNTIITNEYDDSKYDGWSGGEEEIIVKTEDKVYIPSKEDVENYGLKPTSLLGDPRNELITGWLRDRGQNIQYQSCLESNGSYYVGWQFDRSYGVRPVIRISLNAEHMQ